ncbi:MAG TPA: M3 family oligoendopeptidase [Chloroflexota bacterium]|nr:M3 family oligoendopeptidase [Chloroflexota bacterium]
MTESNVQTALQPEIVWKLDDLYLAPDDPQIDVDLSRAREMADSFSQRYRGKVADLDPAALLGALRELEEIITVGYKPMGYASLAFAAQTQDQSRQALVSRVREVTTDVSNRLVFFDVELKTMPEERFAPLAEAPELAGYRHHLETLRAFAPHTLSEPEERLFARMRLTGASAWSQLYTEVTSGLRFRVEVDGEVKELNDPATRALRTKPDRGVRERANDVLYSVYSDNSRVLTYIFNTLFQDHKLDVEARSFSSTMEPTALANELSPEVIERLLSEVEAHYSLAQRYYRTKASLLGLEGDFRYYDLLAPLRKEETRYDFDQAKEMVLNAFGEFHPRMRQISEQFFQNEWIDATPRLGKRGGAFCSGLLPAYHPYVLTNFTGRLDDVFTLAHELGHGVHFYLARQQTPMNYSPTTPMAEVASVFGEILLSKRLRESEQSPEMRLSILSGMIEDAIATIFRQTMYTRWEQRAHAARGKAVVPAEEYSSLWLEESQRLYGDSVIMGDLDRWGWVTIPHFVQYRFYCYSYAFGHLLNFALYQSYMEKGDQFVPGYLELLSSGGRDRPEKLLEAVQMNPLEPGFWDRGFQVLEGLLREFEQAAAAVS